jgi:pyrophosphatase PpaX
MASFEINRTYIPEGIQAVVFDFDNTLVDCIEPKVAQHKHTADQLGIALSDDEIRENWSRHSFSGLLNHLYGSQSPEANRLIIEQYDQFPKLPYDDTIRTLQILGRSGIQVALLTSLRKDRLDKDFEATGINPNLFAYIQTEEATQVHKPNGAVFNPVAEWLQSVGVEDVSNALYVGDALEDMQAAESAGLKFVGIERGFVSRNQFMDAGALCISSLSELVQKHN